MNLVFVYLIIYFSNFIFFISHCSVQFLKNTIEKHHNIPAASQVLLVSGGETLQTNARVCSYSAGTDTNPIFMFSTHFIEQQNPPKPWPSIDSGKLILFILLFFYCHC